MRWGTSRQISAGKGLWLRWPEVFTFSEETVLRGLWKESRCRYYLHPQVQMLAQWPSSDKRNLRRARAPGSWMKTTLCGLVDASYGESSMVSFFISAEPAFPGTERAVGQGQGSQGVPGAAAQHGPADPGIGSTGGGKHAPRVKMSLWGRRGGVVLSLLFSVLWEISYVFFSWSFSSNTYEHTYRPTSNIPLLKVVTFPQQAKDTTPFSNWFPSSTLSS